MSVAKHLMAGRILEEQLFPYPALRDKDREVLGAMVDAIDRFLAPRHQDFKRWDRNEDEEMDALAGFIMGKGSYPQDVLS